MDDLWTMIAAKLTGSVSGSVLALLFQPPKTRGEGKRRAAISLIAGLVLGEVVRTYLGFAANVEMWMASAAIASSLSWWVIGAAIKIIGAWKPK